MCVLERSDRLGGAIRDRARLHPPRLPARGPGSWHPLFQGSAAYAELDEELHRRGLEYVNTELPTATAFPDGSAMFLQTSLEANVAEFDRCVGRRRRRVAASVRGVHGERGSELRRARHRALVARRPRARAADAPPLRTTRAARVRRPRAHDMPRLDDRDVPRPSRRTACSRRGCCTRGSGPTTPCRGS